MSSAFERLQGAMVFSKLDLRNAYNLVRIRRVEDSVQHHNRTLSTVSCRLDMISFVFVYMDDILVFFRPMVEHIQHVCQVLQRLLSHRLFVKAEKCEFHVPQISFLGYIVSQGCVWMDSQKVEAVVNWPRPSTVKQVQHFLGVLLISTGDL